MSIFNIQFLTLLLLVSATWGYSTGPIRRGIVNKPALLHMARHEKNSLHMRGLDEGASKTENVNKETEETSTTETTAKPLDAKLPTTNGTAPANSATPATPATPTTPTTPVILSTPSTPSAGVKFPAAPDAPGGKPDRKEALKAALAERRKKFDEHLKKLRAAVDQHLNKQGANDYKDPKDPNDPKDTKDPKDTNPG